jgi:hypothetical protein
MSLLDKLSAIPDPWNRAFLVLIVSASVAATAILCVNDGADFSVSAGLVLAASVLAAWPFGRRRLRYSESSGVIPAPTRPQRSLPFLGGAWVLLVPAMVMADTTYLGWTVTLAPLALLTVWRLLLSENRAAKLILAPLAMGFPFMVTAVAMGRPQCGGFPAALAVLFSAVAFSTRDLEARLLATSCEQDPASHPSYHRTLAVVSTILFFFGVVALWPWLGKLYGDRYLWVLVVGLLAPLLFFWGRLRQPRGEHPLNALIRFNRLVPYIGIVLLLAIVVG